MALRPWNLLGTRQGALRPRSLKLHVLISGGGRHLQKLHLNRPKLMCCTVLIVSTALGDKIEPAV